VVNRSAVAIKLASLNQREVIDPYKALASAYRSIGLNSYLYNQRPKYLVASDPEGGGRQERLVPAPPESGDLPCRAIADATSQDRYIGTQINLLAAYPQLNANRNAIPGQIVKLAYPVISG
jgi:hypothetical protein